MIHKKNAEAYAPGSLGGKARAKDVSDAETRRIATGGTARTAKLSSAVLEELQSSLSWPRTF